MANKANCQDSDPVLYYGPAGSLVYCPDPYTRYQNDEQCLHRILPAEIWNMVIENLTVTPDAAQNITNSSLYFRNLQQNQLPIQLFLKVIEILVSRNEHKKYRVYTTSKDEIGCGDGWLTDVLFRKTIKSCRFVCSSWNKAIEVVYQNLWMKQLTEFQDQSNQFPNFNHISIEWTKVIFEKYWKKGPAMFLQRFQQSHSSAISAPTKNPFFGRSLYIELDDPSLDKLDMDYNRAILDVLTLFGQYVWYLNIKLPYGCENPVEIYKKLRTWLILMPNLKYLHLNGFRDAGLIQPIIFGQFPLPTFPMLEELKLTRMGGPLASELIRRNIRIPNLDLTCVAAIDENVITCLTNLRGLRSFASPAGKNIIEKFRAGWNLQQLSMRQIDARMITGASKYFEILQNNWSETLTQLHIERLFPEDLTKVLELSRSSKLVLPLVSRLSISITEDVFLDFILPMKNSLKHLEIRCRKPENAFCIYRNQAMKEQTIEFVGFEKKMQESNIWEIFSKLKTIKLICGGNSNKRFLVYTKKTKLHYKANK